MRGSEKERTYALDSTSGENKPQGRARGERELGRTSNVKALCNARFGGDADFEQGESVLGRTAMFERQRTKMKEDT